MSKPYVFDRGGGVSFTVRADMVEALEAYVHQGRPLGDFLRAVVSNDLIEACAMADSMNLLNIPAFAAYLWNEMPPGSFGSRKAYDGWIGRKSDDRAAGNTNPPTGG